MNKLLSYILTVCLLLAAMPAGLAMEETVSETEAETEPVIREENQCGEDLYWSYDDGVLTISGTGAMDDFEEAPWGMYREEIRTVLLSGAVTTVGANAFWDYDALERVEFGGSLREIGTKAFKSCDSLTSVTLPSAFRRFGEESFMSCGSLTEIHCSGGMPSFNLNCLWDTWAKIFYPVNNPWPLSHIEQLESAFQGRIEFLAEDGTDPYIPTEEILPAQTAPATEPEQTVPETVAPTTEPMTEATEQTAPETTEPAAETTVQTAPSAATPTEESDQKPETGSAVSGIRAGLFLISGTLSLVLLGALIFRRRRWE